MRMTSNCVLGIVCVGVLAVLFAGGCNGSAVYRGHDFTLDSAGVDRTRVIEVVREVLSNHRFVIDRVDGRRGIVTTAYKSTQGIASPWDAEQGSLKEESADFVNQHERSVRVTIAEDGEIVVSVHVQRVHRPAWRIETESISRSTHATVIDEEGKREPSSMVTPIGVDGQLARRIGEEITQRLGAG
jgi:hypothetical protein